MIPPSTTDYRGEQTLLTARPTRLIAFRYYVLMVLCLVLTPTVWLVEPIARYGKVDTTLAGWSLDHILAVVLFVIAALCFLRAELKRATTLYVITDNKIIRKDGILSKNTQMIPYTQLERVDVNQSFGQRVLHIGTVVVDTGDDMMKIEHIPHPEKVQQLLSQRLGRRAYVMQR